MGIVCGLGLNPTDCWRAMLAGRSAIDTITSVDTTGLRFQSAAEVKGYDPAQHFDPAKIDLLDRFTQFALIAARQAVQQANWNGSSGSHEVAVVTGTAMGGQLTQDRSFRDLYRDGKPRPHPFTIPVAMSNAATSHVSSEFGFTGPCFTVSTACASATHAMGQAFWMIRNGQAKAAVTGGSEAPLTFATLRAWESMRVMSPDTCRPFSRDRKGMVLGEGAAIFAMERLEDAVARGAQILAEIAGFGMSADAGHITQPSTDGPAAAMSAAMRDGGIEPYQVAYINAHGTGTLANDPAETAAIRKVFGEHAGKLLVSSTKSMHGHALGAAGALEAFATMMALRSQVAPPTANFIERDPACDLDYVPNESREFGGDYALSNSFAFGGLNGTLLLRRWTSQ